MGDVVLRVFSAPKQSLVVELVETHGGMANVKVNGWAVQKEKMDLKKSLNMEGMFQWHIS